MASPPKRSVFPLLLILFLAACLIFPRALYSVRLAMMEMRYSGLVLLLCAAFVWVLIKLGPGNRG
jgi:hypothetical protein